MYCGICKCTSRGTRSFRDPSTSNLYIVGLLSWSVLCTFRCRVVQSKRARGEAETVRDAHRHLCARDAERSLVRGARETVDGIRDRGIRELSCRPPRAIARGIHCQARRRGRGSRRNGTLADCDSRRAHHLDNGRTERARLPTRRKQTTPGDSRRIGQDRAHQSPQSTIDTQIRHPQSNPQSNPQIKSSNPKILKS